MFMFQAYCLKELFCTASVVIIHEGRWRQSLRLVETLMAPEQSLLLGPRGGLTYAWHGPMLTGEGVLQSHGAVWWTVYLQPAKLGADGGPRTTNVSGKMAPDIDKTQRFRHGVHDSMTLDGDRREGTVEPVEVRVTSQGTSTFRDPWAQDQ